MHPLELEDQLQIYFIYTELIKPKRASAVTIVQLKNHYYGRRHLTRYIMQDNTKNQVLFLTKRARPMRMGVFK